MKVPHFFITKKDLEDETYAISLVGKPAIKEEYHFLSEDEQDHFKLEVYNEERRECIGPILIPDMRILRGKDPDNIYTISFLAEDIKAMAHQYLKFNYSNRTTLEHKYVVDGVYLAESWIVEDSENDKLASQGISVPAGTWAGVMRVESDEVWEKVKSGEYKGFSVEVTGTPVPEEEPMDAALEHLVEQIIN